ncbi:MerR family DNA-binding transcriptional regulator [Streptomyces sp. NRRL WC-3549]|uniref:MerR family DNA-binding transcriptional regulator n=1 Tax=Streptomyces sp. NRRL WC-3549 TaxID=1463925 RepID=UPI000A83F111|nr:MerR family DNA-binding transcriptional regulator [Streptomyces sp. NRRL WC-3549]
MTTKTVRYYESLGLISPARLANGYRDYTEHDARMVREARELNRLMIPVERTRPFLECLADGQDRVDECPSSLAGYREAIGELVSDRDTHRPPVRAGPSPVGQHSRSTGAHQ